MAKITIIDSTQFGTPQYTSGDEKTITSIAVNSTFALDTGRVEALVYDLEGNLLSYNPNAKYSTIENGVGGNLSLADALIVYPEEEVSNLGLDIGKYNVFYNFLNNELESSEERPFSIKQISANRKEIRLTTSFISKEDLEESVNKIFPEVITSPSYPDFYLNFGQNRLSIATNILFDDSNNQYSVLIKLYDPLPSFIQERDAVWVATNQRDSISYQVEFEQEILPEPKRNVLKGPNFSLSLNNQVHSSVKLTSLSDLQNLSGITTASRNQLNSILEEKGVEINIDYTDFNNFIHFSSAEERINNFYYKVGLIESASNELNNEPTGSSTYISASKNALENQISSIIENFDGFEYWMYYTSGAYGENSYPQPYPKTNSTKPYTLASTASAAALNWLSTGSLSGSNYDSENYDNLTKSIPEYLLEDPANEPYKKFIEMTGQHFDTLFTYVKDITNRYNADNRLDFGISKDLVGDALKSMGINLYTGNFTSNDLVDSLVGTRIPSTQPDGQTNVSNYITASADVVPVEDVNKEIYKRIYHNLPLLLKQKGSIAGLRTLITCFGVPEEVFPIKEFNIKYIGSSQDLPNVGDSGSILFTSESISLPPEMTSTNYIPSTLLSPSVRVQQNYVKSESYDRSLHYVEAGFSPQGYVDEADHSAFNPLGTDFPAFSDFYFGSDPNYYATKFITGPQASGQDVEWDFSAYIRYIKFFDSSLFQMIKDFIPIRSSTATGVIIKPTIKERQRQRPAQLTYENVIYSGSGITVDYSFDSESYYQRAVGDYDKKRDFARIGGSEYDYAYRHPGSAGGTFNNHNRYKFSASNADWGLYDTATPITSGFIQSWDETTFVNLGYAQQSQSAGVNNGFTISHNTQDEFYNGIFKQSGIGNFDNYLTRELSVSSSVDGGVGVIRTDNNRFNPYKKPSSYAYPSLTKGNFFGIVQWLSFNKKVGYSIAGDDAFIVLRITGDITQELLEGNGSTLSFSGSSGQYVFNVGTPTITSNTIDDYMQFQAIEGAPVVGSEANWLDETTVTFIANWDPDEQDQNAGPWAYNEYNPLINNSFDPQAGLVNYNGIRKSVFYMDADYSPSASSSLNPINTELLISQSASKAAVQDSYYASRWWANSRYNGIRRSSPDFNQRIFTVTQDINSIYTSESLGFNPFISKSLPDQPELPQGR